MSLGACGGGSGQALGASSNPIKVGVITSVTGPSASSLVNTVPAFKARIEAQNALGGVNGRKIQVVVADDQSSQAGMLTAAQTLTQQDKVVAIGVDSGFFAAAEPYLKSHGVPVTGFGQDGPEWGIPSNTNLFAALGSNADPHAPAPASTGLFFKAKGVKRLAVVVSAYHGAITLGKNEVSSAKAAGVAVAYFNDSVPVTQLGGFQAIAQAIKQQNADGIYMAMSSAPQVALLQALTEVGVSLKAVLIQPDLSHAILQNAQASAVLQDSWTPVANVPVQLGTPALKAVQATLDKYAPEVGVPNDIAYWGWVAASAIVAGLEAAGKNPTRASFTSALRNVTDFTADGLAISPVNFKTQFGRGAAFAGPPPGACYYYLQVTGSKYVLPSTEPVCGGLVPNSNAN
jgi:branched-chain amino acid transport system substrate-binding protein